MRDTFRKAPKRFEFGLADDEFTGTPYALESDARRAIELDDADQELGQGGGFATYQAEISPPVYRGADAPSAVEVIRLREQAIPPTAREEERRAAYDARDLMDPATRAATSREFRRIQDPNDTSSVSIGELRRDMIGSDAYNAIDPFIPDVVSDFEYDPQALAYETVPFSDELIGMGVAASDEFRDEPSPRRRMYATDTDLDWREQRPNRTLSMSLRQAEADRERARRASPWSALAGTFAQGALLAPMVARGGGSVVAPSIGGATRGGILQGGREGLFYGALTGADASQAHVLDDAAAIGEGIRLRDPERILTAGGAMLSDAGSLGLDAARGAGVGTALGGAVGGATGLTGSLLRRAATRGGAPAAAAAESNRLARMSAERPIDEGLLDDYLTGGTQNPEGLALGVLSDADAPIGGSALDAAFVSPTEAERRGLSLGQLAREPFVEDPNLAAMRAVGMQSQRQLRGADRAFGSERFARNLDRFGIRRFGEIGDQEMFRRRAVQLGEQTGTALRAVYDDMARLGVEPNVANLERGLVEMAERYNVPGASNEAARAEVLGELASLREHMPYTRHLTGATSDPVMGPDPSLPEPSLFHSSLEPIGDVSPRRTLFLTPDRSAALSYTANDADRALLYGSALSDDAVVASESDIMDALREIDPDSQYRYPWEALDEYPTRVPSLLRERGFTAARFRDLSNDNAFEHDTVAALSPSAIRPLRRLTHGGYVEPHVVITPGEVLDDGVDVLVPRLSMPQFMGARRGTQAAVQDVYRGSVTNPTTRHSVRREMARLNTNALDEAIEATYGPEALAQLRLVREANATARTVAPNDLSFSQQTTPTIRRMAGTSTGATLGAGLGTAVGGPAGGAVGAGLGGIAGYGLGSRAPRYEWSILATINERQYGSLAEATGDIVGQLSRRIQGVPEYAGAQSVDDIARAAANVGDAETSRLAALASSARRVPEWLGRVRDQIGIDPSFFGRRGQELATAAAAGDMALMSYIQRMPHEDPEAAAAIESLAPAESPAEAFDREFFAEPGAEQPADDSPASDFDRDFFGAEPPQGR